MTDKMTKIKMPVKNRLGITYIELMIAFALAGVIGLLLAASVYTSSKLFSDQKTITHISSQNRIALDEITNQIRSSAGVTDCPDPICDPGGLLPDSDFKSSNSRLVIALWPLDPSGNPWQPAGCAFDYIVYELDTDITTNLLKSTYPSTDSSRVASSDILATDVVGLTFDYDSGIGNPTAATEVSLDLTNWASSINQDHDIRQNTTAKLRNITGAGGASGSSIIPLNYAVHATDPAGILRTHDSAQLFGDVYANGCIVDDADCDNIDNGSFTINGDAYTGADLIDIPVTGTKYLNQPPLPAPNINYQYWIDQAATNVCSFACIQVDSTVGPMKVEGPVTLAGGDDETLTITGPIHITGDLINDGDDYTIKVDDSIGPNGTAIIVDGGIETFRNTNIIPSNSNGYLFLISTNTNPGVDFELQSIVGNLVAFSAGALTIHTDGGTDFTGAIIGPHVAINSSGTNITYDPYLSNWPGPNPNMTSTCTPP